MPYEGTVFTCYSTQKGLFFRQAMQCILHTSCNDMQYFTFLLVINHSKLQPAAQIAAKRRRLARILPQTVPRPRDSQIGWRFVCLYVFVFVFSAFLFCYRFCTFPLVFWHIFYLRWFQDLGIPKLVVVIPKAAPHKQQLVVTNISWATGVFQTKYRSVLNKFKKSRNSYYSVLFGELVPKPVIIS